jgi:hypothetical protein
VLDGPVSMFVVVVGVFVSALCVFGVLVLLGAGCGRDVLGCFGFVAHFTVPNLILSGE